MMSLLEIQSRLEEQFNLLKENRPNGYVFLLEHSFDDEDIVKIKEFLRNEIRLNGTPFIFQHNLNLPLLVIATEIGYQYQGNGSDYWPILIREINYPNNYDDRCKIREQFVRAYRQYNIFSPLETDWAKNFPIICWPITNAVLPLDIRLQFMQSLDHLSSWDYSKTPKEISQILRNRLDSQVTIRYRNWLNAMPIIGELAIALFNESEESPYFTSKLLERLRRDIKNDKKNGAACRKLWNRIKQKVHQKTQPKILRVTPDTIEFPRTEFSAKRSSASLTSWTPKPPRTILKKAICGKLFFNLENYKLMGEFPENSLKDFKEIDLWNDFSRKLRYGIYRLDAWERLRMKPTAILYSESFEIPPEYWEQLQIPLFEKLSLGESDLNDILKQFIFNSKFPIFFNKDGNRILYIEKKKGTVYCLAQEYTDLISGIENIHTYENNFSVLKIDTSNESAVEWCKNYIHIRETKVWRWLCVSDVIEDNRITINEGDPLYLWVEEGYSVSLKRRLDSYPEVREIIDFSQLPVGTEEIEINDELWSVIVLEKEEIKPLCSLEFQGALTIDSLKKGLLHCYVNSHYPLINIEYVVTLASSSGFKLEYTGKLDLLSNRIALFPKSFLKNDSQQEKTFLYLISLYEDLKLSVEIKGLFYQEVTLESDADGIWWINKDSELPCPESDNEELICIETAHRDGRFPLYMLGVQIFCAALKNDNGRVERIYRAPTVIRFPQKLEKNQIFTNPPRKIRKFRQVNDAKDGIGLFNVLHDFLAFSQMQPRNSYEILWQQRALNKLEEMLWTMTCGRSWSDRTQYIDSDEIISVINKELSFIKEYHENVSPLQKYLLKTSSQSLKPLREKIREFIIDIFPLFLNEFNCQIPETIEENLNEKVYQAAKNLDIKIEEIVPSRWNQYFKDVLKRINAMFRNNANKLKTFIYPQKICAELPQIDEDPVLSLEAMIQKFTQYQKMIAGNPYRGLWNESIVKNIFCLFFQPNHFIPSILDDTLQCMLKDRQSMRIISYLRWHKLQQSKIEEVLKNE